MLKKLHLDQTKTYEVCIATYKISEMLIAFIQGRKHFLRIGSEQGDIPTWDDLIIEHDDGQLEHIQIKRQHTDFSTSPPIRGYVNEGKSNQRLQDLSPLDKSLLSLAKWTIDNDPLNSNPKRLFVIEVPDNTQLIKEGITISHLSNFCHNVITPSTTPESLATLEASDNNTKRLFQWLTHWCEFKDWQHILTAFKALKIKQTGNEVDIESRTETLLNSCFHTSDKVRKQIHTYITDNSSYTSAISPRPLFGELKDFYLPSIVTWTQYDKTGTVWNISGINDTDHDSIELAPKVVKGLWNSAQSTSLKVKTVSTLDEDLPVSFIRLIVHFPNLATAHLNNSTKWKEHLKVSVGGTLGISDDDCHSLSIIEDVEPYASSDQRPLNLITDARKEAEALKISMDEHTWSAICDSVHNRLLAMTTSELLDAIELRWSKWKAELDTDEKERLKLCSLMLLPNAEGQEINVCVRYGPKTSKLIAEGIIMLLVVSVALGDESLGWKLLNNSMSVETRAIKYWSGPSGEQRKIRKLASTGIEKLIGKESSKVLILSGIENSASDINEESLAYDPSQNNSMASPHKPLLIVTNSTKVNRLIEQGNIANLQKYFNDEITKVNN